MNFAKGSNRERVVLGDITGMIDVVFLLIIFFLTTSTLVRLNAAPVDLPALEGEEEPLHEDRPTIVNIMADGRLIVDQREVGLEALGELIVAEVGEDGGGAASLVVLVRADEKSAVSDVDSVARLLLDHGVTSWSLGTVVPSRGRVGSEGVSDAPPVE